jgi:hypothetical protein
MTAMVNPLISTVGALRVRTARPAVMLPNVTMIASGRNASPARNRE